MNRARPTAGIIFFALVPIPGVYTVIHLIHLDLLDAAWTAALSSLLVAHGLKARHRLSYRTFGIVTPAAMAVLGLVGVSGMALNDGPEGLRAVLALAFALMFLMMSGLAARAWRMALLPERVAADFDRFLVRQRGGRWRKASLVLQSGQVVPNVAIVEGYVARPWKHRRLDVKEIADLIPE